MDRQSVRLRFSITCTKGVTVGVHLAQGRGKACRVTFWGGGGRAYNEEYSILKSPRGGTEVVGHDFSVI